MTQYVLQDRSSATKWALTIADGQLLYTASGDTASSEPIVEDILNAGNYWKIYIDNGELAYESDVTVQDDALNFTDTVDGLGYSLIISDGEMGITATATAAIVRLTRHHIVRYTVVERIKRYEDSVSSMEYTGVSKIAI